MLCGWGSSMGYLRLLIVGLIVFVANAGLLVLQLLAGKLLAPFVGSSLETWTLIIAAFLSGIALGNLIGGRYSARLATTNGVTGILLVGGLASLWMLAFPEFLQATAVHRALPLAIRIPVLAFALCLPPGFALSLLTPAAIRLGLPDVSKAGRIAGLIFALCNIGCLLGNYVTGFYLIPHFTINTIVIITSGSIFILAFLAKLLLRAVNVPSVNSPPTVNLAGLPTEAPLGLRAGAVIVFVCSMGGLALELTASRLMAQVVGVSIYTWTGVIGVMLAGSAVGNWLGGLLARPGSSGRLRLTWSLLFAAMTTTLILVTYVSITQAEKLIGTSLNVPKWLEFMHNHLADLPLIPRILLWTFSLFFLPMFGLGLISPQVIRLCVRDVHEAGSIAGRIYAWSTAGAIVGTFLTGYLWISELGMFRTILLVSLFPALATALVMKIHKEGPALYVVSIILGAALVGMFRVEDFNPAGITAETNYYTIRVVTDNAEQPSIKTLQLDLLIHSTVDVNDPRYIRYEHEWTQLDFVFAARSRSPAEQRVLVIGGGGYTFPRCTASYLPTAKMDVVEIDPGVTKIAYSHLGLDPKLPITSYNQDGRQFVEEVSKPKTYDVITLDAVNDLSVPAHLLTKEFNDGVANILKPDGVYLVTVIDILEDGPLWKAVVRTLKETFPHVEILSSSDVASFDTRNVYCIYAAQAPLDLDLLDRQLQEGGQLNRMTHRLPAEELERLLAQPTIILRDQFAPVDNMMSGVFRKR
jgi:spermidine synthase